MIIASDDLLRQVLFNVLDNALEASPAEIGLCVAQEGEVLCLTIRDTGPGFAGNMLQELGRPYQSTKEAPGHGLGLFLVVNVIRKLGGHVMASNRPEGGAIVELRIPLSALAVEVGIGR